MCSHLDKYREQVLPFLSHLIGYEGAGSILDHLQKQGWASSLIAGLSYGYTCYGILLIYNITIISNAYKYRHRTHSLLFYKVI